MAIQDDITLVLIAANIILTLILVVIYLRNYRTISSKMTLGLVIFAGAFLLENIIDFVFYNTLLAQGVTGITTFYSGVNGLELVALLVLAWVTWK